MNHKYSVADLLFGFRAFAAARAKVLKHGGNDNAGAIHSAERYLNLLGLRLNYDRLSHQNNYRRAADAVFPVPAKAAYARGERVLIEHVAPLLDLTKRVLALVDAGKNDEVLLRYIKRRYKMVLLTPEETLQLNKQNRSRMTSQRLRDAGIKLAKA
jgi:hypothetical protein